MSKCGIEKMKEMEEACQKVDIERESIKQVFMA